MALSDMFGIDSKAGNSNLDQALAAIQGVQTPTAEQLTLPQLQKYINAGILTQQDAEAILANPDIYSSTIRSTQDNTGKNAQSDVLSQLDNIIQNGGSTAINQANLTNNLNQVKQQIGSQNAAVAEQAQEKGVGGSNLSFIQQLLNNQSGAQNANSNAVNSAANNAQLALNAISQKGTLGGTMQSQAQQQSQAQAQAAQQVAEYNSQLGSNVNLANTQAQNAAALANYNQAQALANANTGLANETTRSGVAANQTAYADAMQKANGIAGVNEAQAANSRANNQSNASLTGNLIGAGATMAGGYMSGNAASNALKAGTNSNGLPAGSDVTSSDYTKNMNANSPLEYAEGGSVPQVYSNGGFCFFNGGKVDHDHSVCMRHGGPVPGTPKVGGAVNSPANDTVKGMLAPGEIVLPRSVTQGPNPAAAAAQFVNKVKHPIPAVGNFHDVLSHLANNGLELHIKPSRMHQENI